MHHSLASRASSHRPQFKFDIASLFEKVGRETECRETEKLHLVLNKRKQFQKLLKHSFIQERKMSRSLALCIYQSLLLYAKGLSMSF